MLVGEDGGDLGRARVDQLAEREHDLLPLRPRGVGPAGCGRLRRGDRLADIRGGRVAHLAAHRADCGVVHGSGALRFAFECRAVDPVIQDFHADHSSSRASACRGPECPGREAHWRTWNGSSRSSSASPPALVLGAVAGVLIGRARGQAARPGRARSAARRRDRGDPRRRGGPARAARERAGGPAGHRGRPPRAGRLRSRSSTARSSSAPVRSARRKPLASRTRARSCRRSPRCRRRCAPCSRRSPSWRASAASSTASSTQQLRSAAESEERLRATADALAAALKNNATRGRVGRDATAQRRRGGGAAPAVDFDLQASIHITAGRRGPTWSFACPGASRSQSTRRSRSTPTSRRPRSVRRPQAASWRDARCS